MKVWVPFLFIALGMVGLMAIGLAQASLPELQVAQVVDGEEPGRKVKVHGKIGRIERENRPLVFHIVDKQDASKTVKVEVDDVRPDLFKVENDVAVEGVYEPGVGGQPGILRGTKIYTKCPSKYEASKLALDAQKAAEATGSLPADAPETPYGE